MKNPLYPQNIVSTTYDNSSSEYNLNNYNRCLVITLKNDVNPDILHELIEIFNKDVSDNFYKQVNKNYHVVSVPTWIIKTINKNFIIFNVPEDDLLPFNFEIKDVENKYFTLTDLEIEYETYLALITSREQISVSEWKEKTSC